MSKNIGITFYFTGLEQIKGMTLYDQLNTKLKAFFLLIASKCDGDMFVASVRQERVLSDLRISRATYYSRLNKLVDIGLLKKVGVGCYEVNKKFAHIVSDTDRKLDEAMKKFRL